MTNNFHHLTSLIKIFSSAWVWGINTFKSLVQHFYNAVATKSGCIRVYIWISPHIPLKGGARPRSNIMETERAIFLLHMFAWNWLGDRWVLALKKHNKVKIWAQASSSATTWHLSEIAFSNQFGVCPLSFICHLD